MAEPAAGVHSDVARFQGLCEHGALRVAETLGCLLGRPVGVRLQEVRGLSSSALSALAEEDSGEPVAGLRIQIHGEGNGWALILLPLTTVYRLLQILMGTSADARDLTETERSAIQEVGNIMVSSFLNALGDRLGRRLLPSAPAMHLDSVPHLARAVLASARTLASEAVAVHAQLEDPEHRIQGRLFIISEAGALEPARHGASGEGGVST